MIYPKGSANLKLQIPFANQNNLQNYCIYASATSKRSTLNVECAHVKSIYIYKMSQRHTRNDNTSASGSASARNAARPTRDVEQRTDFRVMRCFCGCTALTFDQIEHFAMMNVQTLIVHPAGKKLFEKFLTIGHHTDKSEAMELLNCYDLCDKVLKNRHPFQDQDVLDDLKSICPNFTWEDRITNQIENNNLNHFRQVLKDLKRECVHSIECHHDYDRFRRELLRKIGKS